MVDFNYELTEDCLVLKAEIGSLQYEIGQLQAEIHDLKSQISALMANKYENDLV